MRLFVKSALFAACVFFFASCDFGFDSDSFQNRAGAYFKEMTSTAAVAAYKIDTDNVQTDRSGNICFGYESDRTVTFTLRNPQHYSFLTNRNMTLGLAGNDGGAPMPLSETVTLVQDSSDTTKLVLTFPADFLKANPMGANISPVITMMHPVSLVPFTPYKDLKISSNATPPMPNGAVVMQTTETPSRWVVCFNMPNSAIINEFHSDLESVSVNDSFAKVSVSGGIISLESGSDISASEPPGLVSNQNTGLSFSPNGQAIYYSTGDEADEKERVYTVKVTDNAGLVSSFGISTRGFKLSAPDAYLTDDANFANPFSVNYSSAKNFVSQEDDGSSFIYLHGTAKTEAVNYTDSSGNAQSIPQYDYDPSNAQILYEVYLEDTFTTLVDSGMIKGLGGKIPVPAGTSYVRAYVRKPLYSDSEVITWWCRAVSTRFFVSEIGDDMMNSGSRDKPYRTIQKAVDMFGEGIYQGDYDPDCSCYIKVLGDELTPPDDFDFALNGGAYINIPDPATVPTMPLASATVNIEGDGGTKTVNLKGRDAKILSASCGNVVLTNINLTGADFSSDSYNEALVEIASAASVRMNSVAISKNNLSVAATSAINIVKNSGTLRMNDSSVAENTRSIDGSTCVVLNCDGGETTLSNTSILNHHEDWTPVYIAASATFDMTGGEIKDNTESNYIIESGGLVTMTGVTVQNNGNLAASSGIHIVGNKMTLKDCVITKNKADCGAGIMVDDGELYLDSCSITENTAADDGAGVFCSSSATKISLKGKNVICDNHTEAQPAKQNNVYLADSAAPPALPTLKLTIESDISGSKIGLHYPPAFAPTLSASIPFTDGYGYGTKNKEKPGAWFISDYNYGISDISSNEAAFVVSSGSMYGALDYTFDFELKAADGVTAASVMYFGKDASFVIAPTVARREQGATPASSDLYLNPADRKLYLDAGFTKKAAGDELVTLTAKLYSGGFKAEDLDITWEADKISLAVPASKATLADNYTIKVFRTFLGVDSSSSFAVACNKSAEAAAAYIQSLSAPGTYDVEVEGVVGPGVDNSDGNETTITSSDEGLAKVAKAIRAKNGSSVKISLDARATSPRGTTLADLALYNDGKYFMNCLALTAARLPDWMLDVVDQLFEGCANLASVTLGANTEYIGASAFKGCGSLTSITLPESVTEIAAGAFKDCGSLASVTLPESVTEIAAGAFKDCGSLASVTLPKSVTKIAAGAFDGCVALATIRYNGTKAQFAEIERASGWHTGVLTSVANCSDAECPLDYTPSLGTPLTIEAIQTSTEITITLKVGATIKYRRNDESLKTFTSTSSAKSKSITLSSVGDKLELYGENKSYYESNSNFSKIISDKSYYLYGNIMSLVAGESGFDAVKTLEEPNTFSYLFYNSDKMQSKSGAPLVLPATTLTENCYYEMFYGCKAMASAPALPATTLAGNCYCYMFGDCDALTSAPDLPATTLAESCYYYMFYDCDALTSAPELPATTLAESCYSRMFSNCDVLTSAPSALPATTLAKNCCYEMFCACEALTSAPELPATTLAENCYYDMFYGCKAMASAPELPATTLAESCYRGMFYNCYALTNAPELPATTLAENCYYEMFRGCKALASAPQFAATTLAKNCCYYMFCACEALTSAPELPATTLAESCYAYMFSGCVNLATTPDLPATTLAESCYNGMFYSCSALTNAPALPVTTLAENCYNRMFSGCQALTSAPALPATELVKGCYIYMFSGCVNLATAPELPATTLAESCYEGMFSGCKAFTSAPTLPLTELAKSCYAYMFSNCANLATAPELPATTLVESCYASMFSGCAKLTTAPAIHANVVGKSSCSSMFSDCTGITSVDADMLSPADPAVQQTLDYACYQSMFRGCSNLTNAPNLPAKTLALGCYRYMFQECDKLDDGPIIEATSAPAATKAEDGCCYRMFYYNKQGHFGGDLKNITIKLSSIPDYCCKDMFSDNYTRHNLVITCYASSASETGISGWLYNNSDGTFKTPYTEFWGAKLASQINYYGWSLESIPEL